MPQFNWGILGPILLLIAGVIGGGVFLISQISHHVASLPQSAAPSVAPTLSQPQPGGLSTPAGGVRLAGRVTGTPHVRSDPSSTASVVYDLRSGDSVEISACSPSCGWYLITAPGQGSPGWVSSAFIQVQGDDHKLPVIK